MVAASATWLSPGGVSERRERIPPDSGGQNPSSSRRPPGVHRLDNCRPGACGPETQDEGVEAAVATAQPRTRTPLSASRAGAWAAARAETEARPLRGRGGRGGRGRRGRRMGRRGRGARACNCEDAGKAAPPQATLSQLVGAKDGG